MIGKLNLYSVNGGWDQCSEAENRVKGVDFKEMSEPIMDLEKK